MQKRTKKTNVIGCDIGTYESLYFLFVCVSLSFFFENMQTLAPKSVPAGKGENRAEPYEADNLSKRETLELVRAYYRINDPIMRKKVFDMVKSISSIVAPLPEGTPRRGRPRKIN